MKLPFRVILSDTIVCAISELDFSYFFMHSISLSVPTAKLRCAVKTLLCFFFFYYIYIYICIVLSHATFATLFYVSSSNAEFSALTQKKKRAKI